MNAASPRAEREKIELGLLAKFGEAFELATTQAKAIADPALRALGAARIALEHAVLQTALEKDLPAPSVAAMLEKASPQQVAQFIRDGKKKIYEHYGIHADAMVAALSARVANVDISATMVQTEAVRQLVEQGRGLAHQAINEMYQTRGRFAHDFGGKSDHLTLQVPAGASAAKLLLQNHMVFIESAIDNAVRSGRVAPEQARMLKDQVEHHVFRPPSDVKLSAQFKAFYDHAGPELRGQVMAEARTTTSSKTVSEIAERLAEVRDRIQRLRGGSGVQR